jgi:chromosome segregation ATPase
MVSEIAALRQAVDRAKEEAERRAVRGAELQAEITTLRGMVKRAEQVAQERQTTAVAMVSEIAALRQAVDRAEHVLHDRNAATEAMQDEIVSLRNDIAAARQVGREMFVALRVDPKPSLNRGGPDRWWCAGLRVFGLMPLDRNTLRAASG